MADIGLGAMESRFADIIWAREPVSSAELVKLAEGEFGWKKSTAFNLIRKLGERGFLRNDHATVTALVKREQVRQYESAAVVERGFGGSLPAFVAAFLKGNKLSPEEAEELRRMIDESGARHD